MKHSRLFMVLSVVTALGIVGFPPAAAEDAADGAKNTRYLALGDSVAFGFNPTVPVNLNSYIGYPRLVSRAIDLKVANASCVGETSGSFLSATAPDFGCRAWRAIHPLFVTYTGTQLDFAVTYLKSNPKTELVTINIGGNDLAVLQQTCHGDINCELAGFGGVLATLAQNLTTTYTRIRVEAGYKGPIVALTYYALNYTDPVLVPVYIALNGVISSVTTAFGGKIADGFTAFQLASIFSHGDTCAAGLRIKLPNGTCDIHPSRLGHSILTGAVLFALAGTDLPADFEPAHQDSQASEDR